MFEKIIQHYSRILKIAGGAFLLSILLAVATDSYLLNGMLGEFFEVIVMVVTIFGGILTVSSVLYVLAILVKIISKGLRQVSKSEITLLIIGLGLTLVLLSFFLQEFYSPY
jgi:hypothetical protein